VAPITRKNRIDDLLEPVIDFCGHHCLTIRSL
jgi:hypothetical protein